MMPFMKPIVLGLAAAALLAASPALAQYTQTDRYQDHRWNPDNSGFSAGVATVPTHLPGTAKSSTSTTVPDPVTPTPQPPEPPKLTGSWKYNTYYTQFKGTAGFVVNYATLDCYNSANVAVEWAQCPAAAPAPGQCSYNGYGVGDCDPNTGWVSAFRQTSYSPSKYGWYD